jgi:hypothetical protein
MPGRTFSVKRCGSRGRAAVRVFRTYFSSSRGSEALGGTWSYLDLTALGRQETWEDSPAGYPQSAPYDWWNWHDGYDHPELAQGAMRRARDDWWLSSQRSPP